MGPRCGRWCCTMGTEMTLAQAQEEFAGILARLSPSKVPQFVGWIGDGFGSLEAGDTELDEAERQLRTIRKEIKAMIPLESCFKRDRQRPMNNGNNHVALENGTEVHEKPQMALQVDDFLFDEDDIEQLVLDGDLQRYYCGACGSKEIESFVFVTHSTNLNQLRYIFTHLLTKLGLTFENKVVVDIGSRLGGVLYAAALYCPEIADAIGIEPDKELCDLQTRVIDSHSMWNKVNVVCDDFRNQKKVVGKADVIMLNDTFRNKPDPKEQVDCWHKLRAMVKPATILVHIPSIWTATKGLELDFEIEQWLEQLDARQIAEEYIRMKHVPREDIRRVSVFRVRDQL